MNAREVALTGHVLHISLHSTHEREKLIIWQVHLLVCQQCGIQGDAAYLFVTETLSNTDWGNIPAINRHAPSINEHGRNYMQWELRTRLRNPIIQSLSRQPGAVNVRVSEPNMVIVGCERALDHSCSVRVTGAYLHCDTTMDFSLDSVVSPTREFWFSEMFSHCLVSNIEVYLKTTGGLYYRASSATQCRKRAKDGALGILDIFNCESREIQVAGQKYTLSIATATFHVLWVDEACMWNGALAEFFRALHNKLFGDREGVAPTLTYVCPGATPEGTPFPPYFSAFPHLPLVFGRPRRLDVTAVQELPKAQIAVHWPPFKDSILGDQLLIPGISPKKPGTVPVRWPLWVEDVNLSLCETTESVARIVDPHSIVIIKFSSLLCQHLKCHRAFVKNELEYIATICSSDLRLFIQEEYNRLLATIFTWAAASGYTWAAIDKTTVFIKAPQLSAAVSGFCPSLNSCRRKQCYEG
ncbi:ORF 40 [Macacine gammaherpesvirus 5]|uniref:Helicase-primase n=1 Tax=Rhesus monkey rhadinovirus H26-95 TaxID=69256 RepID=Q9J2K5_9GAMA|nr:helicase-primase [Rhesus monkey rhadinovirus H26-95]QFN51627.1 ORF 40 [Macacine gammaherpesvirus 5]QFN51723.1 ORF 40 [Macacine gammaherpesvirus 5]QFN51814.1 ORF 40 [Macacine gammaherpesvirus 5]QFQ66810.1 ORF 40 [Macacine gammaherpesvirus 5]